jgi:hypothetical protein
MFIRGNVHPCVCVRPGCCRNKGISTVATNRGSTKVNHLASRLPRSVGNVETPPQETFVPLPNTIEPPMMTDEAMDRYIEESIREAQRHAAALPERTFEPDFAMDYKGRVWREKR